MTTLESVAERAALFARSRAFVTAFERGAPPPEPFDLLACAIARHQARHSPAFANLCQTRGVELAELTSARRIPSVTTDAFKVTRVATFSREETAVVFRTSGTTEGTRGEHALRDTSAYDAASVAFGRHWLTRDWTKRAPVIVVGPSRDELPDSSLGYMCERFVEAFGVPASTDDTYVLRDGVFDLTRFDSRVATATVEAVPVLVLGTSFAFVNLLDVLQDAGFALPPGSRVMQTGGFKGKSREVPAAVLRRELARAFDVPEAAIVAEYGMTELSSQFYERTLFVPEAAHGVYAEPPWARVEIVDPVTEELVADGATGLIRVVDLMNIESAVAVLTADQGRRVPGGFELLGRATGAPQRGCSLSTEEILGVA